MNKLSYQTLKEKEFTGYLLKEAPERVIQFGEGNFMRAFVDFFIDNMNEKADFNSKVVLVQPIAPIPGAFDLKDAINEQEGLYTLYLRGCENGEKVNKKRIISCVSRCLNAYTDFDAVMACAENPQLRFISCNTTEAGITYDPACRFEDRPASSYPGKLTQFLYHRFQTFGSQPGKGFLILACELIDDNGKELEKCVLKYASQWNLGQDFIQWLQKENTFCSTLVDRIVTGFPRTEAPALNEENGYEDNVMDTGEIFGFWVIEGPQSIRTELPFEKAGLPILVTDDHKPYKQRKVRILNGAHTSMVLGAYLAGQDIVRDCMEDPTIQGFMNKAIYDEIIPTLTLPQRRTPGFRRLRNRTLPQPLHRPRPPFHFPKLHLQMESPRPPLPEGLRRPKTDPPPLPHRLPRLLHSLLQRPHPHRNRPHRHPPQRKRLHHLRRPPHPGILCLPPPGHPRSPSPRSMHQFSLLGPGPDHPPQPGKTVCQDLILIQQKGAYELMKKCLN